MISHHSLGPGMRVIGALGLASLCTECIAERSRLDVATVDAELAEMNAAREQHGRHPLGPIDARCQRCEAPRPVFRLR
jgi:hypothetical protein